MPLSAITPANVATFLDGTNAGGSSTIYGIAVSDAAMTSRVITPTVQHLQKLISDATITANQALADSLALHRAGRLALQHLRQTVLSGNRVDSYSIAAMSVTKPAFLVAVRDAIRDLEAEEQRIIATLLSSGEVNQQGDLVIVNPILNSSGQSQIDTDQPPYGGFV